MLTPSQQHVLNRAPQILDQFGSVLINAPAGYGKTYIARKLAPLGVMSATTNDAAKVLGDGAKTIHSLLGLRPRNGYLERDGLIKIDKGQTVVIDEASMIGKELYGFIKETQKSHKLNIIYLGDIEYQLPPVNDEHPKIFTKGKISLTLNEPVRQDIDSDIFKLCSKLRANVDTGDVMSIDELKDYFGDEISSISFDDYIAKVTDKDICTAFTNHVVDSKARRIHYKLHGKPLSESITELPLGVKNNPVPVKGHIEKFYPEPVYVEAIEYFGKVSGEPIYKVWVEGTCFYWSEKQDVVRRGLAAKAQRGEWDWRKYYQVWNSFINLESPYSRTVHRLQGQNVDQIAIDWRNITKRRNIPDHNEKVIPKLLYVACSRARKKVEIIL